MFLLVSLLDFSGRDPVLCPAGSVVERCLNVGSVGVLYIPGEKLWFLTEVLV